MKRLLVVCAAALLPCFLVSAQEADNSGTGVGLSVIPRLDLSPQIIDGKGDFTLGNSSLYSLFEGDLTEHLSFSVANHWLSDEPKYLYQNTFHSDDVNWLDWAYLTYTADRWDFSLGKDMVTTGGLEFDDYDFEVHLPLTSTLWNFFACYQWGGKVGYTLPSGNDAFHVQFTTSPFGEKPFKSGLFNYSLEWRGTHGIVETIWSATAVQTDDDRFFPLVSLGQRFDLGDWTVGLDLTNGSCMSDDLVSGLIAMPSVSYSPSESVEIFAKGGWETVFDNGDNFAWGGAGVHWYPVDNLRIHALAAYNDLTRTVTLSAGLLYNLTFKLR